MFNVYYQAQKSACMQNSATLGRTDTMDYRPCIAAWHSKWGSVHTWTPTLPESGRVRTPGPSQDRRHWQLYSAKFVHELTSTSTIDQELAEAAV